MAYLALMFSHVLLVMDSFLNNHFSDKQDYNWIFRE